MKKFDIYIEHENDGDGIFSYLAKELSAEGDWVEAEEAEKLEQLNKEMLDALKSAKWIIQALQIVIYGHTEDNGFMQHLQSIIKKAEEV